MTRRFPIYLIYAADNFGLCILYPLLSMLIFKEEWGLVMGDVSLVTKNWLIGLALCIYPLAQYFGVSVFGYLADRLGRKKTLLFTLIGTVLGFLLSAFSVMGQSLSLFLFSRCFTGFFAGNVLLCMTALSDLAETDEIRARSFGRLAFIGGICWLFATIIGGRVAEGPLGPTFPFVVTAILAAAALVAMLFSFRETVEKEQATDIGLFSGLLYGALGFRRRNLRLYSSAFFLWFMTWVVSVEWFAPLAMQKFGASTNGITYAFLSFAVAWAVGNLFVSRALLKRFTLHQVTVGAAVFYTVMLSALPFIKDYAWVVVAFTLVSLFGSVAWSNLLNLISLEAGESDQGMVLGIGLGIQSLGWIIGPIIGAALAGRSTALFYGTLGFGSLLSIVVLRRGLRGERAQ